MKWIQDVAGDSTPRVYLEIPAGDINIKKQQSTYFKNKEDRVQLLPLRFVPWSTKNTRLVQSF